NFIDEKRQGEIIGHLLRDGRHIAAAQDVGISEEQFLNNAALLVTTTPAGQHGQHRGIAALHHIEQDFFEPADFVLLKAILRLAESRLAEIRLKHILRSEVSTTAPNPVADADRSL